LEVYFVDFVLTVVSHAMPLAHKRKTFGRNSRSRNSAPRAATCFKRREQQQRTTLNEVPVRLFEQYRMFFEVFIGSVLLEPLDLRLNIWVGSGGGGAMVGGRAPDRRCAYNVTYNW
jgi:hypothetical protein